MALMSQMKDQFIEWIFLNMDENVIGYFFKWIEFQGHYIGIFVNKPLHQRNAEE